LRKLQRNICSWKTVWVLFTATFSLATIAHPLTSLKPSGSSNAGRADEGYQTLYATSLGVNDRDGLIVQANPGDITFVPDPATGAPSVMQAHIDLAENYSKLVNGAPRAEVLLPESVKFMQGGDYRVHWRTWLPADFKFDARQLTMIMQVHQSQASGSPTLALTLLGEKYAFSQRGGVNSTAISAATWICCANSDRGRWVDWTLRYVPDESGARAYTELYKDGRSVFRAQHLPNAYEHDQLAYPKFGLYKPHWARDLSDVESQTVLYGPISVERRNSQPE
jgi:hypothetical protein